MRVLNYQKIGRHLNSLNSAFKFKMYISKKKEKRRKEKKKKNTMSTVCCLAGAFWAEWEEVAPRSSRPKIIDSQLTSFEFI